MAAAVGLISLEHPATPPSLNVTGFRSHWAAGRRAKMLWEHVFWALLVQAELPKGLDSVHATARLRFPVKRRRDEGNYRAILEKSLGDALTSGNWLQDDTVEHFTFGAVTFDEPGPHRTIIDIDWREHGTDHLSERA